MKKDKLKVCVLGATGSIGKNTLDVIRKNSRLLEPVLFSAHNNIQALLELKKEFPNTLLALSADEVNKTSDIGFYGKKALLEAITFCGADIAVNGIAGAAGLEPSLACIDAGMDLALANKETIVMAGPLVLRNAKEKKIKIIPVDSEHSAINNLLLAYGKNFIEKIILTASGGPFLTLPAENLDKVTVNEALSHPTWDMGQKITIDSATLANKGLEVIEAFYLFEFPIEKIQVVIHPQSIVHSMIQLKNGAVYAQLSKPDMRLPIQDALLRQSFEPIQFGFLDFTELNLNFKN